MKKVKNLYRKKYIFNRFITKTCMYLYTVRIFNVLANIPVLKAL